MLAEPLIRVFLFGNAVHEHLVPLLSNNRVVDSDNNGIIFVHSAEAIAVEHNGFCVVRSHCVPYNTQLFVLPPEKKYSEMNTNVFDCIFIVDAWTAHNDDSMKEAKELRQNFPYTMIRIVLINTNRKILSGSMSDEKAAIESAAFEYSQEGFSVTQIHDQNIAELFFWQNLRYQEMLKQNFTGKLLAAKNSMRSNYGKHYVLLIEKLKDDTLQHKALGNYTQYDKKRGFSKLEGIVTIASNSFFEESSLFMKELYIIFKTFTIGVSLWDEKKIFDKLKTDLIHRFCEDMEQILPALPKQSKKRQNDEIVYGNFMIDTSFDVNFYKQCSVLFNETAKELIRKYLNNILNKMEEYHHAE